MQFVRAESYAVTHSDVLRHAESVSDDDAVDNLTTHQTRRCHRLQRMPRIHARCTTLWRGAGPLRILTLLFDMPLHPWKTAVYVVRNQ